MLTTATALASQVPDLLAKTEPFAHPTAAKLPRWRGFNLLEKFVAERSGPYVRQDLKWISDWGFNFVRLPMSYRCWTKDPARWKEIDETVIADIDRVIEWAEPLGVHVNLNFHRAPGYCVNPPHETLDLWTNAEAQDACAFHWAMFARRYKGIPSSRLSFDLLNEPADMPEDKYAPVIRQLVSAIRAEDANRLIVADGLAWGNKPVTSLVDLKVAQSTRGYAPVQASHYKANWMEGSMSWPEPTWPMTVGNEPRWDKDRLRKERIKPWQDLAARGVGVHVGEWGAYNHTPHTVVLAWMRDQLDLWKEAGWGWALWNFRGSFGVLDSDRKDVVYEALDGHKLDRKMLDLLRAG